MIAWYFAPEDRKVGVLDWMVEEGECHVLNGTLDIEKNSFRGSVRAVDALGGGPWACIVRLGGETLQYRNTHYALERTYLRVLDATDVLNQFARDRALEVSHLWDMPEIVRQYLTTGDPVSRIQASSGIMSATCHTLSPSYIARKKATHAAWHSVISDTRETAGEVTHNAACAVVESDPDFGPGTNRTALERSDAVDRVLSGYNDILTGMLLEAMDVAPSDFQLWGS